MANDNNPENKKPSSLSEQVAELLMRKFDDDMPKNTTQPKTETDKYKPEHKVISFTRENNPPQENVLELTDDINDETLPYEFSIERLPMSHETINNVINHRVSAAESKKIEEHIKKTVDIPVSHGQINDTSLEIDESYDKENFIEDNADYSPIVDNSSDEFASEMVYKDFAIHNEQPSEKEDMLKKICDTKRQHIEWQKAMILETRLREQIYASPATRGFISAINKKISEGENALIAEIKKASPSRGIIRRDFEPGMIAKSYAEGGATCLSVLTDSPYFQGRDEYLNIARRACDLPLLRKDFILDPYQVVESRALGADCILLIMAALNDEQAIELEEEARKLSLDILVEVHDEKELERALKLKTMLVGINNRNLKTLQIDLENTERLAPLVPYPRTVICESGIYEHNDILRMNNCRVKGFLVGESLMVQDDIKQATMRLLGK